jgi:hypothetical protein
MPIPVTCPQCKKQCRVPDQFAGKQGRCPQCMSAIQVPKLDDPNDLPILTPTSDREEFPRTRVNRRSDRRRFVDDWDDDREEDRGRGKGNWKRVSAGMSLLLWESFLNLAGRVGLLILLLVQITDRSHRYYRSDQDTTQTMIIGCSIPILLASLFALLGRIRMGSVPHSGIRSLTSATVVLNAITLGFYLLAGLFMILLMNSFDYWEYQSRDQYWMFFLIFLVLSFVLWCVTEIVFGRCLYQIGKATGNTRLSGWGTTMVILFACHLGSTLLFLLLTIASRRSDGLGMFTFFQFIALNLVCVSLTIVPRIIAKNALRNPHLRTSSDEGLDEDDFEGRDDDDEEWKERPRRRSDSMD